jgi:hypothetical protein
MLGILGGKIMKRMLILEIFYRKERPSSSEEHDYTMCDKSWAELNRWK